MDLEIVFDLNSSKLTKEALVKLNEVLPKVKELLSMLDSNLEIQGIQIIVVQIKLIRQIDESKCF